MRSNSNCSAVVEQGRQARRRRCRVLPRICPVLRLVNLFPIWRISFAIVTYTSHIAKNRKRLGFLHLYSAVRTSALSNSHCNQNAYITHRKSIFRKRCGSSKLYTFSLAYELNRYRSISLNFAKIYCKSQHTHRKSTFQKSSCLSKAHRVFSSSSFIVNFPQTCRKSLSRKNNLPKRCARIRKHKF